MILETVEISVIPGQEAAFETAALKAVPIFQAAQGSLSFALHRLIERPSSYRLTIGWQTLEDHTVTFRQSDGFQQWRALVGHYFAAPPSVDHSVQVIEGF